MAGNMILYRGSLKSCNYHCSYCPFSKHVMSKRELAKDEEQWERFCQSLQKRAEDLNVRALMVVPYGEALIYPWYWDGLARLSACGFIDGVGAQTNLSFSADDVSGRFCCAGGKTEKLRLWATFHPEMTSVDQFVKTCVELKKAGVSLCAGAVGVPGQAGVIRRLREVLPGEIYLWINKMDGLGRPYTREERAFFQEIDPYFARELEPVYGDVSQCGGRLFVEGDGKMRTCNISPVLDQNWYDWIERTSLSGGSRRQLPAAVCSRKLCSCYLAYGGRGDGVNQALFGPYPLFRIPRQEVRNEAIISGDITAGGTPAGAGCPDPGDKAEVSMEKIGSIPNPAG